MIDNPIAIIQDCELFERNLKTIQPYQCVDDMIIHFHFRYLEYKNPNLKKIVLFVMPCTVQFIQTYPMEMVKESLYDMKLDQFKYVFYPMSDIDPNYGVATHWSLLYLDRSGEVPKFFHFDSMNQCNQHNAHQLARKICELYQYKDISFECVKGVTQPNGYDCGVYVMAFAEQFLLSNGDVKDACSKLTTRFITDYRAYILNNIKSYVAEQENH